MLNLCYQELGGGMGGTIPVVAVIVGACSFIGFGCNISLNGNGGETKEDKQMKWCNPQQLSFPWRMYL